MKDDIDKAMKCGEIMLPVFADFSEAFDIIDSIFLYKSYTNYIFLTHFYTYFGLFIKQTLFVQTDSSYSSILYLNFRVP